MKLKKAPAKMSAKFRGRDRPSAGMTGTPDGKNSSSAVARKIKNPFIWIE
jgi:hypothetical protein